MTNLKLKRLSEFIDDMIQKYQIEETKNIKKSLRRKFVTELEAMGQWDKANSKTFGRNRTKVFNYEILDRLEKRCERYLVKKSGFDFDKFTILLTVVKYLTRCFSMNMNFNILTIRNNK